MRKEKITLLETALDHLTGEELGSAITALSGLAEILDVLYLPGTGKKNRPAGLLQVMCLPSNEALVRDAVFEHTHTLGIRCQTVDRYVLERRPCGVEINGRNVPAKAHLLAGVEYARPEADAVDALARDVGGGAPGQRFGIYTIREKE